MILLTCLVLQADARGLVSQTIGTRRDCLLQVFMTFVVVPLIMYAIGHNVKQMHADEKLQQRQGESQLDEDFDANPIAVDPESDEKGEDQGEDL